MAGGEGISTVLSVIVKLENIMCGRVVHKIFMFSRRRHGFIKDIKKFFLTLRNIQWDPPALKVACKMCKCIFFWGKGSTQSSSCPSRDPDSRKIKRYWTLKGVRYNESMVATL